MTAEEAIEIAARKARQLNMPWGPGAVATRLGFWPFPRNWRVVCRVPAELSETTMIVNDRNWEAFPDKVRVARRHVDASAGAVETARPSPPPAASPPRPVVSRQGVRDATFMILCPKCEYKTTVTVTIGADGRLWSGDGLSHEVRCQNCSRTFFVSNDELRQYSDRFV